MWLIVSITSYFINAGVHVADKFLLSKKIHSSIVYAFYVGIWSIFNFTLLIFDFWVPTAREFGIDILAGLLFLVTLIFWYKALHQSEATRVVPIVGALVPIFSLLLGYIFLDEVLEQKQILAFFILIAGGILISVKHTRFYALSELSNRLKNIFGNMLGGIHASYRPMQRLVVNSLVSATLFATYYVIIKYVYTFQPFIGGFVWSRLGTFLGVIIIFLIPQYRKKIIEYRKHTKKPKSLGLFLAVRLLAALAFIMLNWAISLGSVAMINALQGTQYVFLFLLVLFLSARYPKVLKEEWGRGVILQKSIGIVLVMLGLYILVV
jgi:drug/metabolite transporter (DMT)-like permease